VVFAVAVAVALGVGGGCKPKTGGKCRPGQSFCDGNKALACRGGTYVEATCGGPLGCKKADTDLLCDQSESTAGAVCVGDDDRACTPDKTAVLVCKDGRFVVAASCRGKKGCSPLGKLATCDATIADRGEACEKDAAFACSGDGKTMLKCTLHKWETHRFCRGASGCTLDDDTATCDESVAQVDDPCSVAGRIACSTDKKNELICQTGRFAVSRPCKTACRVSPTGHTVKCE
jgi:hypothetical protein